MKTYPRIKIAAMHASPVFMDIEKTVDKACLLIEEAANNGAGLVVFPESFVPGYPAWSSLRAPRYNNDWFRRLAANSVTVPGPEVRRIAEAAKRNSVTVSLGISELSTSSSGALWNTNLLIGSDGRLLNHHRKITPCFHEKLTWANGDGAGLEVVQTEVGRIGTLICAENCNGLARHAMISQNEQIHITTYPAGWFNGGFNLADAARSRAESYSSDAKVFTIICSLFMTDAEKDLPAAGDASLRAILDEAPRNPTLVIGPGGNMLVPPLRDEEGILYADIDIQDCVVPRQFHDPAGYMNRFDIFQLTVDRSTNDPVDFLRPRAKRRFVNTDLTDDQDELLVQSELTID
jgi:aliphatic nitrilase